MEKDHPQTKFFLRQLLDAGIEGILAFDRECRYTAWNQAMERISGMRSEDVLGKSAFDVFPFLKESGEDQCFHAALAGESSTSDYTPYTVPETGRHGFFKGYYSPLRDERNEIVGGIAVIHDTTEHRLAREEAQEAHQRLTFHVENSPLAVIEWDSEFRVSRWSESAQRLFGWEAEEVLGKHVGDWHFVFDDDIDAVSQVTQRQRVGAELLGVQRNRNYTRGGSILYCEWYNSVLRDDASKMVSVLSLVLDVTARKLAEEERVALLARERGLRKQAEEADRLKDEFLATLSHELRTPLTSILGWATLIRSGDIDEENVEKAIQTIERNARSQARLIDDLLDVSRIITGKLQLEVHPVDMAPLVEAAIEALRPAADAKGIQVETEVNAGICFVSGDPNRLRQVIWNLIMNAIKFTPRAGNVNVRLECVAQGPATEVQSPMSNVQSPAPQTAHHPLSQAVPDASSPLPLTPSPFSDSPSLPLSYVRLTVRDNGEGMKPEFLPYVFHRFRQEESSISRKAGGLGLGLAVVRHLVELHGGNVSADSPGPGQGSTFIVELPAAQEKRELVIESGALAEAVTKLDEGAQDSSRRTKLDGIRILLVEDDDDSRDLLRVLLARRGAEVITASSSAEALNWLTQQLEIRTGIERDSTPSAIRDPQPEIGRVSSPGANEGAGDLEGSTSNPNGASLPDIIISDLGMPDEDGYELMRKMNLLLPHSSRIPAIAFTGYATSKDRERALSAGYQLHLAKPVEPEALVAAILTVLAKL